jgi:hypothetical protein
MKTIKTTLTIALLSCAAFSVGAHAADDAHKMRDKQIEAEYKSAMELCKPMKGNNQDVCEKEAKAKRTKAEVDNKAAAKTGDVRADANKEKREADYKVAKEKCDAMSGDAKDMCQKQAKTTYNM